MFRQVARTGSLSGARVLGWTQPAVSQHVRRLEEVAGMPLVDRARRGVAFTEAGQVLLQHADAVADRLEATEQDRGRVSARVTVLPRSPGRADGCCAATLRRLGAEQRREALRSKLIGENREPVSA